MILLLAGLVLSIFYAFRIPRLRRVRSEKFPEVAPEIVAQWRTLELRSIYALSLTTIGMLVICSGILVLLLSLKSNLDAKYFQLVLTEVNRLCMLVIFGGLCVAGNFGAQAGKLRKAYGLSI